MAYWMNFIMHQNHKHFTSVTRERRQGPVIESITLFYVGITQWKCISFKYNKRDLFLLIDQMHLLSWHSNLLVSMQSPPTHWTGLNYSLCSHSWKYFVRKMFLFFSAVDRNNWRFQKRLFRGNYLIVQERKKRIKCKNFYIDLVVTETVGFFVKWLIIIMRKTS